MIAGNLNNQSLSVRRAMVNKFAAIGVIIALSIALFIPVLRVGNSAVLGKDTLDITSFFHIRSFVNWELRHGRLPLWNPFINCGYPFHADGEGAIFYPVNLLLTFLPVALGINICALLHLILAGIFLFLYLREIKVTYYSCLLGALFFMFSSAPITRFYAGHVTNYANLALLPALMWLWERWRYQARAIWLFWVALAYGSLVLAGAPQFLFYSSIYLAWFLIYEVAYGAGRGKLKKEAMSAGAFIGALLIGMLIGAIQLLPSYDFLSYSFRADATYKFCSSFSFAPENFITLLVPKFFGDMANNSYWGRNYLWEMWIYIGIFPLALAILAGIRSRASRVRLHLVAVLIFAVMALGSHTPLLRFFYKYVPFFAQFRGTAKFTLFSLVSLCVLAAIGADRLLDTTDSRQNRIDRRLLIAILALMLLVGFGLLAYFGRDCAQAGSAWQRLIEWRFQQGETYVRNFSINSLPDAAKSWAISQRSLWRFVFLAAAALITTLLWRRWQRRSAWMKVILFALTIPELWIFSHAYMVTTPTKACTVNDEFLSVLRKENEPLRVYSNVCDGNAFTTAREETVVGYTSTIIRRYNNFLTAVNRYPRTTLMIAGPEVINDQMFWANIRYLILGEGTELPSQLGEPIMRSENEVLYRVRLKFPRAYFTRNAAVFANLEGAMREIESGRLDIRETDLVELPHERLFNSVGPPVEGDRVEFVERLPNQVTLKTVTAGSRFLILADAYDPNWRCLLDGKRSIPIYPVNIAFRGVIVPPGKHRFEFIYSPGSFYCGAIVSGLALVVLFVAFGAHLISSRCLAQKF